MENKRKLTVEGVINRISQFLVALGGFLIVLMVFTTTYGVFMRYAFNNPDPYAYELTIIFLLWSFVFGISTVERLNGHIRVDFISNRLPKKGQFILLYIIVPIMGLFVSGMLASQSWNNALKSLMKSETSWSVWGEPVFPIKIMIALGYAVLFLVLLTKLYKGITGLIGKKDIDE